jgi:peptidoglycan hydrolase-like protein with peptidoglycan-binding domain
VPAASGDTDQVYTVAESTIGRALTLSAKAQREVKVVARNAAAGTVTAAEHSVLSVSPGDVLYRVDERPVLAAKGPVPFYRDLTLGTRGRDVAQLNAMLRARGLTGVPTGDRFTSGTAAALTAFQRQLHVQPTGRVEVGDIVALPALPAQVSLTDAIAVGAAVVGGEDAVAEVDPNPTVVIELTEEQSVLAPPGTEVVVTVDGVDYAGLLDSPVVGPEGLKAAMKSADGKGHICPDKCANSIPAGTEVLLPAKVIVVPERSGPAVPIGAIETAPDGTTSVRTAARGVIPIKIQASSGGVAIVSGLRVGDRIILPTSS